jgi:hypothetical protein
MSLTDIWKKSREQLDGKQVHQIIAFAGEGKLRDGGVTCSEFREFLSHVSSSVLCKYVEDCLGTTFTDSGLALQDIVNQVGKRLGFQVEDGRYQGTSLTSVMVVCGASPMDTVSYSKSRRQTLSATRTELLNIEKS